MSAGWINNNLQCFSQYVLHVLLFLQFHLSKMLFCSTWNNKYATKSVYCFHCVWDINKSALPVCFKRIFFSRSMQVKNPVYRLLTSAQLSNQYVFLFTDHLISIPFRFLIHTLKICEDCSCEMDVCCMHPVLKREDHRECWRSMAHWGTYDANNIIV